MIKDTDEHPDARDVQSKVCGKGCGALSRDHSPSTSSDHQPVSSPDPIFVGFYGGIITWAQLIKSLAIGY